MRARLVCAGAVGSRKRKEWARLIPAATLGLHVSIPALEARRSALWGWANGPLGRQCGRGLDVPGSPEA